MIKLQPYWTCPGCKTAINSRQNVKKHRDHCVTLKRTRTIAHYASEIDQSEIRRPFGESLMANSEKDRQNELAMNDSVCEQSFEHEQSCEPLTLPQHTVPMQQIQTQYLEPIRQHIKCK